MITKICPICGKEFEAYPSSQKKYCSAQCRRKAQLIQTRTRVIPNRVLNRKTLQEIAKYDYYRKCAICGWTLRDSNKAGPMGGCELHHIIPISEGGEDSRDNLILLCPNCHKMAHVGLLDEQRLRSHIVIQTEDERVARFAEYLYDRYPQVFL